MPIDLKELILIIDNAIKKYAILSLKLQYLAFALSSSDSKVLVFFGMKFGHKHK